MKNKLAAIFFVLAIVLVGLPAFAQTADCNSLAATGGSAAVALCRVAFILNSAIPVLITLGVLYFIWGVVQYVLGSSDEAKSEGKDRMIWGLIGLAVVISIWGLVYFLRSTFAVPQTNEINIPCIPSPGITCPQQTT